MQQKSWQLAALLVLLVIVWWLWPTAQPAETPMPKGEPTTAVVAQPVEVTKAAMPVVPKPEQLPQSMQQSFALVATAYAEELQLPDYVRPLTLADTQLLAPNQFIAQQLPLEGGASVSIEADKYRFSAPEPVVVRLKAQNIELSHVQVLLRNELSGELLITETLSGSGGVYAATLPAEKNWDGPFIVEFQFSGAGQQQSVQTGIEYSQPVAVITAVKPVLARGSDMVIPVRIQVKLAGTYRLRANLLNADGQPLAQLTGHGELAEGLQILELKAHKMVLQSQHMAGEDGSNSDLMNHYLITTFQLERRSPSPFEPTRYGHSLQPEFALGDFDPSQLMDTAVEPSAEDLQRLEFLQTMAGG